jgi:hypothetical protein
MSGVTVTSTFETRIATTRQPPSADGTNTAWLPGLPLILSVTMDGDSPNTTITVGDTVALGGDDNASYANLIAGPHDTLIIKVDMSAIARLACNGSPNLYLVCTAVIDAAGASFRGSVQSTCADRKGDGEFEWIGHIKT